MSKLLKFGTGTISFFFIIIFALNLLITNAAMAHTYNISAFGSIVEPYDLKIFIVTYGFGLGYTDVQADYIGNNFDFLVTDRNSLDATKLNRIKELNPNIIILVYGNLIGMHTRYEDWAEVNTHEDWFLHDIDGNRLVMEKWDWYLMDLGNVGWRNHYADRMKGYLDQYSQLDGVLADDCWRFFRDSWSIWNVPDDKLPPEIAESWRSDMIGMLQLVKQRIGNKLLIPNTQDNTEYVTYSDGIYDEGFVHAYWQSADGFLDWSNEVNALRRITKSGKYYLALSGVSADTDTTTTESIRLFTFCSYLLAAEGEKASFGFYNGYGKNSFETWLYPIYDSAKNLGSPINDYYSVDSVYARDFENGKVLVNPSTDAHSISLDQHYTTLGGEVVYSVHLDGHSGIILFKNLS